MTSFEATTKIFSGTRFPKIFHPETPLGQVILYECYKNPDKVIQISADDGIKITCGELSVMMKKVATYLNDAGLKFGDIVGFCAQTTSYLAPTVLGCVLLGLPISPVDVHMNEDSIVAFYKETQPKLVFCDYDQMTKIQEVLRVLKSEAKIVVLNEDFARLNDNEAELNLVEIPLTFGITSDKICAAIMPSSGSTGAPKLTRISHAQSMESTAAFTGFIDETLLLNFVGLFWISGFCSFVHCVLNQHARLITKDPFNPKLCTDLIEKFKVTQLTLTPTQVASTAEYLQDNLADLSSVKFITTGAWPITEKTLKLMGRKLPNGLVCPNYGMTEVAGLVSRSCSNDPISSSVGKLCANTEVRILLSDCTFGGVGEVGEILIRKYFNIIDYLNNEDQTRALIDDDGWIHSADMGYFDENLNLYHVGRAKFMIRCHNRQVNPVELEEIIGDLEGVRKVCVVALPNEEAFEVPAAVVERTDSSVVTAEEIYAAVAHFEPFKQLIGGVFFVDQLPLTTSGKINRNAAEKVTLQLGKQA